MATEPEMTPEQREKERVRKELDSLGTPASMLMGNAARRHEDPEGWDRWVALSESWGY